MASAYWTQLSSEESSSSSSSEEELDHLEGRARLDLPSRLRLSKTRLRVCRVCALLWLLGLACLSTILVVSLAHINQDDVVAEQIEAERVVAHLVALQEAGNRSGGSRSITRGYNASLRYVERQLASATGFEVRRQCLPVPVWDQTRVPTLEVVAPFRLAYNYGTDFVQPVYGGSGDSPGSNSSLHVARGDWEDFPRGAVALVPLPNRSELMSVCFAAERAGASALVLINSRPGRLASPITRVADWREGMPLLRMPVFSVSESAGALLVSLGGTGRVSVSFAARVSVATTCNLHAVAKSTLGFTPDSKVICVGAHLDSSLNSLGINDNASGAAGLLEIAIVWWKQRILSRHDVQFSWFAANEIEAMGSHFYVDSLSAAERSALALYINMDSLASPNGILSVYDSSSLRNETLGSRKLMRSFLDYFKSVFGARVTLATLDGTGDYLPFAEAGIPVGGVEAQPRETTDIKTPAEAMQFGGLANVPFDACQGLKCDNVANTDTHMMMQLVRAVASNVQYFAQRDGLLKWLQTE